MLSLPWGKLLSVARTSSQNSFRVWKGILSGTQMRRNWMTNRGNQSWPRFRGSKKRSYKFFFLWPPSKIWQGIKSILESTTSSPCSLTWSRPISEAAFSIPWAPHSWPSSEFHNYFQTTMCTWRARSGTSVSSHFWPSSRSMFSLILTKR